MDSSLLVHAFGPLTTIISATAALLSAIYAYSQAKQSKENVEQARRTVLEASKQNELNALIALKNLYETKLPHIKEMAERISHPEAYESAAKPLYEEYEEYRKKLQKVNLKLDKLYELYVATND